MRNPFQSPGRMKNSSYNIAPTEDRTHDLPHTEASNMVKVSYAPNHSATAAPKYFQHRHWSCSSIVAPFNHKQVNVIEESANASTIQHPGMMDVRKRRDKVFGVNLAKSSPNTSNETRTHVRTFLYWSSNNPIVRRFVDYIATFSCNVGFIILYTYLFHSCLLRIPQDRYTCNYPCFRKHHRLGTGLVRIGRQQFLWGNK